MKQKTLFIKSLYINKTLPTFISTDVDTPPRHPRAATCNSSRENEIYLFVKPPLLLNRYSRKTQQVSFLDHENQFILASITFTDQGNIDPSSSL